MNYIILALIGLIIAVAGGIYLAKLLYYKKFGVMTEAEVVKISEIKKRTIIWMLGSICSVQLSQILVLCPSMMTKTELQILFVERSLIITLKRI